LEFRIWNFGIQAVACSSGNNPPTQSQRDNHCKSLRRLIEASLELSRRKTIMKSIVAVLTLTLGFGLCNLSGWSNKNANNANTNSTASTNENTDRLQSEKPTIAEGPPPRTEAKATPVPRLDDAPPPPAPTPQRPTAPISGGVLNGKAISLPKPAYPAIARSAHASGTVTVQVTIDEAGNVISAHPVSGHPLLQAAAVAAARQAKFAPTKLSGQPVKVMGVIVYNFVAQ
jgi:TonB family protein